MVMVKSPMSIQTFAVEFVICSLQTVLECIGAILEAVGSSFLLSGKMPIIPGNRKRVVIVGASFAGCKTEQILARHGTVDITLVDSRSYFEYVPGALRCFVDPSHFRRALSAPLSILKSDTTTVVTATVTNVLAAKQQVVLHNGNYLDYNYLVLCAGSTYTEPIKPMASITTLEERQIEWNAAAHKVAESQTVVIVGAGAVGVELAGEILTVHPNITLYLFDMAPTVLPGFPSSSAQYATKWLQSRGAILRLSTSLKNIGLDNVELADRSVIQADIVFKCMGSPPNVGFLRKSDLRDALTGPKGAVEVNDHLQVLGHETIYCAGDMMYHARSNEVKLGHTAEVNSHLCAGNILRAASGMKPTLVYPNDVVGNSVTPFIYCVSLGKYDATLGFNGLVLNGPLFSIVKWVIEWSKVMAMQKKIIGVWFWLFGDFVANLLSRTVLQQNKKKVE